MLIQVRASNGNFEIERDTVPDVGDPLEVFTMVYEVTRVLAEDTDYGAVLEAKWIAGPAETPQG